MKTRSATKHPNEERSIFISFYGWMGENRDRKGAEVKWGG